MDCRMIGQGMVLVLSGVAGVAGTVLGVEIDAATTLAGAADWVCESGSWTFQEGRLTQDDPEHLRRAFYRKESFADVALTVRFRVHDVGSGVKAAGLILRSETSRRSCLVHYDTKNRQVILQRWGRDGSRKELGRRRGVPLETGTWHHARAEIVGEQIAVYLDDNLLLEASDDALSAGLVGVYTSQGTVDFEGFSVSGTPALPAEPWRLEMPHDVPRRQGAATILRTDLLCRQEGRYIGWPTICRTDAGELLVVFSGDRDEHVCPWGKVQMVRSHDGGATWSEAETVCNSPLDDRDAGIIQTRSGALVLNWFTSVAFEGRIAAAKRRGQAPDERLVQWSRHAEKLTPDIRSQWLGYWTRRSEDGGRTWQAPVRTRGSSPHGPIELSDGRLLHVGRRSSAGEAELIVEESRDDGRSWTQIASIETAAEDPVSQFHEPHLVETAEGRLVAQFRFHFMVPGKPGRDNTRSYLRQAVSEDGGHTWSVAQQIPILGYPPHLIRLENGWLLSVYGRRHGVFGEYACISRDGGVTWDVENEICLAQALNGDLGYPASVQLPDGSIYTVYYQVYQQGEKTSLMGTHWRLD